MKKLIRTIIPVLLLVGVLAGMAHAAEITPRYTGITVLTAGLDISGMGRSVSDGTVHLRSGYTADVTVELKQDGTTIKTWTSSGSSVISAGGIYYVASGHEYTVTTTATVYDANGKFVESVSKTSPAKEY